MSEEMDEACWKVLAAVAGLARGASGVPVWLADVAAAAGTTTEAVREMAWRMKRDGLLHPIPSHEQIAVTPAGLAALQRDDPGSTSSA